MQSNKLRMAIRSTAAVAILGVAAQANAVELSTGDYETNLYGFARVVAAYDIDEDISNGGRAGNFNKITPGDADTADGHFGMDANTSRVGLSVVNPEGVKAVIEFDFDNSASLDARIRHAYGEYKNVKIGRHWSNYNSWVGNTANVDFDGVPGTAGTQDRTEQITYMSGPFSVSLENPIDYGGVEGADEITSSPALTAKLEDSQGGFSYAAGVMAKQTGYDSGANDDSAIGYAGFLAGKIAITDMISIQGAINFSDGANAYVYRAGSNFGGPDAYVDANGDLETIEAYGGALGASFGLGGGRSVNVGYGMATQDLDDAVASAVVAASRQDTNTTMYINYMWSPVDSVSMGVQFENLETETQAGEDGDANRIMYLAQYNF
ncbi:DcaP family trimeric outer membrane transporter [Marinobacter algicola]|uniref:DcaP family trimeric outer membrane transporter n=1 Tax=Marinobacter algicola TaxID=236100 RepID=UPI003BAB0820